ncbi:bifunctional riboflavin kinase/FAD synthetase [Pleionea sp. CnH1-48]|uniref:bifunctional riboflavin kinase/FAD synthetase n=1 Tax=Pleionea sp. CnH1-48 TaxID=2954494 RepID=UPI00209724DA|nr:bifunctional riboflavin kinase/FAD synthetase [Pleionea sp. CnH1-48]MCO7222878.1 bifunctional riboflavin kinase/FAD synthetase [Pleionea sp. CnH1-48]
MELIRGLHNLERQPTPCVATIGKFDGVHCGHQQILAAVTAKAKELAVPSSIIVFEPDPQEYFAPQNSPARLTRFREKWQLLEQVGIDKVVCMSFNRRFASMPAPDFIHKVLIEKLRVAHLIVGDDFRFGAGRTGDYALLSELGAGQFGVQTTQSIKQGTERISSSLIRTTLDEGKLSKAKQLLGRDYAISGTVVHGQKLGRQLGFPTLNVPLLRRQSPLAGVFVVAIDGISERTQWGVANVGSRPTIGGSKPRVEAHVFDFDGDCYGRKVEITFLHKIRDEKKFSSVDELAEQIQLDSEAARHFLKQQ